LSPALGRAMGATYKPTLLPDFGAGADIGNRPILLAVLLAALLHALLLFGVGFAMPEPRPASARNMEVMLVTQAAPMALPPDADSVKAQADRAGETLVPLPELDEPQPEPLSMMTSAHWTTRRRRNPCQHRGCHQSPSRIRKRGSIRHRSQNPHQNRN
jgi:hypothetical protein